MTEVTTAIIKSLRVGRVDRLKGIVFTCEFDMNGSGCALSFSSEQILKMMEDTKCYDDVQELVGLPCELNAGWGESCSFIGMWKK